MPEVKPFDRLDEAQKQCCIDIAIGIAIIASRVPSFDRHIFKQISDQWAFSAELDKNVCRYALSSVTDELLFDSRWEYHVSKHGPSLICEFVNRQQNGEHP
jgi:hypothetical protein